MSRLSVYFGIVVVLAAMSHVRVAQMPPGMSRAPVLENDAVLVARLRFEPGAMEQVHTHPFSAVVIQLTPGTVEMTVGGDHTDTGRSPGFSWFISKGAPHATINRGVAAFEQVTIGIKPTRRFRSSPPPPQASPPPPGIARTPLLENDEARVVRVTFEPGAREDVHTHPFDLVVVQLTPGRLESLLGSERAASDQAAGSVLFLPKDVPHAVANAGTRMFQIMSVALK